MKSIKKLVNPIIFQSPWRRTIFEKIVSTLTRENFQEKHPTSVIRRFWSGRPFGSSKNFRIHPNELYQETSRNDPECPRSTLKRTFLGSSALWFFMDWKSWISFFDTAKYESEPAFGAGMVKSKSKSKSKKIKKIKNQLSQKMLKIFLPFPNIKPLLRSGE